MTDIVERLRKYGQHYEICNEAAVEIERLRVAVRDQAGVELSEENDRLIDEIERLRTEREANVAGLLEYENRTINLMVENKRLKARIEQLEERGNMADN